MLYDELDVERDEVEAGIRLLLRRSNWSTYEIAERFGVSIERVENTAMNIGV